MLYSQQELAGQKFLPMFTLKTFSDNVSITCLAQLFGAECAGRVGSSSVRCAPVHVCNDFMVKH